MQIDSMVLLQARSTKIYSYVRIKKYEILLASFLLLIFGNTFTDHLKLVNILNIYQNMATGAFVLYSRRHLRNTVVVLILLSLTLDLLQAHYSIPNARNWHNIIYLVFFSLVSKEVYKEVLYAKKVSRELLAAAMCGFVLLCLIATFLFYQVEISWPNSFSTIGQGRAVMNNLNYFSFATLLTTGYGDIAPLSLMAKRTVMLMGLAGHFYTVFITSIIIGKYLSRGKNLGCTH